MVFGSTAGSEAPSLLEAETRNLYCFLFSRSSHLNLSGSSAGISAIWAQPPVCTRTKEITVKSVHDFIPSDCTDAYPINYITAIEFHFWKYCDRNINKNWKIVQCANIVFHIVNVHNYSMTVFWFWFLIFYYIFYFHKSLAKFHAH